MKYLKFTLVPLMALTLITACNDDETELPKEDTKTTEDYSLADNLFENVSDVQDQAEKQNDDYLEGGKTGDTYLGTCVTITFDTVITSSQNTMTVDFGTSGCTGKDGRVRKGKVFVEYNGRYADSGTVILTTFEDYFVNDHQLMGSRTVTNLGNNTNNKPHFSIVSDGKVIKANNGGEVIYKSNRIRTWVEGETTLGPLLGWLDDVYEITGTASGTSSAGRNYEVEITKALKVELICRWITEGTFELRPDGLAVRTFDFGNGDCDPKATVTIGNITVNFIMP